MKKYIYLFTVALLISALLPSCSSKDSAVKSNSAIPELLTRNEAVRNGKEWDAVQSEYQDYKLKLAKNPKDYTTSIQLAQLFLKEARVTGEHGHYYPSALIIVDGILANTDVPADLVFMTLLTKGSAELSQHNFKGALETGKLALAINDKNAQAYGVLVDANVELGNYDEAVKMADKMIALKPDIRSYARVSYLREIYGDVDGSIEAMKLAAQAGYPGTEETAWAMLTLGNLLMEYNKMPEAMDLYEAILSQRENYPFAIHAIGEWHEKSGDKVMAKKFYDQAVTLIPEVGYYISLAKLDRENGEVEKAINDSKVILKMLSEDVASGHNMNLEYADVYLTLLEDPKKALEYAQKEYELRPANIDVNRLIGKIYVALDQKEEARKHLDLASLTKSKNPELLALTAKI